jgi:hypothetical protein
MKKIILLITILFTFAYIQAQQVIENPAVAEQSLKELVITKVSLFNDSTVIDLSVENKLAQGGWFCADNKIYIETSKDHQRLDIIKARGIPRCPSAYNFKRVGEILNFALIFPKIPKGTSLLDLIEDCDKSCFHFKDIILDEKLNSDIVLYTKGVEFYGSNKINEAIDCFSKVVEIIPAFPTHVYGYSYFNLVRIYFDKGDKVTARFWYDQLEKSTLPDKQYFINSIKKEGILIK